MQSLQAYTVDLENGPNLIQLNYYIIPLRTLHHNLIQFGNFFAATTFMHLSNSAKYPVCLIVMITLKYKSN